jgi:hypothetical protein
MVALQDNTTTPDDNAGSTTGINQDSLDAMAANATRVRFAENVEAGWRFDVSDSLDD